MEYNGILSYYDDSQSDLFEMGRNNETKMISKFVIVFSILICIVGLFGNLLAIFVIVILKEYQRSVTYWYILQLALADSLFLLTLPFKASENLNSGFIYPEWMCKAKETILFLNYYASVLFLMILSIDRYIAVCHSFSNKIQVFRKRSASYVITMTTWIVSFLLCMPALLYSFKIGVQPHCSCSYQFPESTNYTELCINEGMNMPDLLELCLNLVGQTTNNDGPEKYCRSNLFEGNFYFPLYEMKSHNESSFQEQRTLDFEQNFNGFYSGFGSGELGMMNMSKFDSAFDTTNAIPMSCHYWSEPKIWHIMLKFNFIVMFLLPLFVMIVCYLLIVRRFSAKTMTSSNTSSRRRITIMCAALVTSFVICWLPFHVNHLAKTVGLNVTNAVICDILPAVGSLLAYFNSAVNPFLYNFLGSNFFKRWNAAIHKVMKYGSGGRRFESTLQWVHISKKKSSKADDVSSMDTVVTETCRRSNGLNGTESEYKAFYRTSYRQK